MIVNIKVTFKRRTNEIYIKSYQCVNGFDFCYGLEQLTLSSTVTTVESNAIGVDLSGVPLLKVTVPATTTSIGYKAFGYGSWIYGKDGSAAETYAKENNCAFISDTTAKSGNYYYKTNSEYKDENGKTLDGIIIVAYTGTENALSIGELDGKKVVGIGPAAFTKNNSIKSLTFGKSNGQPEKLQSAGYFGWQKSRSHRKCGF